MATQLGIYNRALQVLGETRLASLTERRAIRYELDVVWGEGPTGAGGVKACLEMGYWNFAMRSTEASYDSDVSPSFGYIYAISKPADWVRTDAVCTDEDFTTPLFDYADEQNYWFCYFQTLYIRYVSNDASYGGDLTIWPETFEQVLADYFAWRAAPTLTKSREGMADIWTLLQKDLSKAKSQDAMNQPTRFPTPGRLVGARVGGRRSWERGSRGNFTG